MTPVEPTSDQALAWCLADEVEGVSLVIIGGPEEGDGVVPCPALVTCKDPYQDVIHVAYQLDDAERERLAAGGTLWLTCWGTLPVHLLSVGAGEP